MKTKYEDIKPDTSLYSSEPERSIALAKVAQAMDGKTIIQAKRPNLCDWDEGSVSWALNSKNLDYRVKPEPVVTTKTEWHLFIPKGGRAFDSLCNASFGNPFSSRSDAINAAWGFTGYALVAPVVVTYTDGVETSRTAPQVQL